MLGARQVPVSSRPILGRRFKVEGDAAAKANVWAALRDGRIGQQLSAYQNVWTA